MQQRHQTNRYTDPGVYISVKHDIKVMLTAIMKKKRLIQILLTGLPIQNGRKQRSRGVDGAQYGSIKMYHFPLVGLVQVYLYIMGLRRLHNQQVSRF